MGARDHSPIAFEYKHEFVIDREAARQIRSMGLDFLRRYTDQSRKFSRVRGEDQRSPNMCKGFRSSGECIDSICI